MNEQIKVSVIIPVYNSEKYIRGCLDSILGQTLTEIEVIAVDDGSTDSTPAILDEYAQKDSRVTVIHQENAGAGAARNHGIEHASGQYLSILDADDFFAPQMLERSYKKAMETAADIVVFSSEKYHENDGSFTLIDYGIRKALLPETEPFTALDIKQDVFKLFVGWSWDKLFRTEFIRKEGLLFQIQRTSNDLLFVFSAVLLAKRIVTLNEILAYHRISGESLSVTREKSWHCFHDALIELRRTLYDRNIYERFEQDFINYSLHFSLWNLETLREPTYSLLRDKLKNEWFSELGIASHVESYFYNKGEYKQYLEITSCKEDRRMINDEPGMCQTNCIARVSVIIPVYNGEKHLRQCLDSVLSQTLKPIEILCVDDGSTDGSAAILEEYAGRPDSPVTVLRQANLGSGPARNLALENAHGEFVAFMDADDFYPNGYVLGKLYDRAVQKKVFICGGSFSRYAGGRIVQNFSSADSGYLFKKEGTVRFKDYQFDYGYHRFIYKRSFLAENGIRFPALRRYQDPPFFVNAMLAAGSFYAIPDITYCYRKDKKAPTAEEWNSEKLGDMIKGITMELALSAGKGLPRLHALVFNRLEGKDYFNALIKALDLHNYPVLSLVLDLYAQVDRKLLEKARTEVSEKFRNLIGKCRGCLDSFEDLKKRQHLLTEPAVTVIMPSLNVEPYIRVCIESVLKQTLEEIEILCVDAGSTDGTLQALEQYAGFDPRIRIIRSEKKSYGYQVNLGIRAARGKYIGIVETDDVIDPDMYKQLLKTAEKNALEYVKADFYKFYGYEKNLRKDYFHILNDKTPYHSVINAQKAPELLVGYNPMYIWAGIYNTDFLRKNSIFCNETPGASFQDNGFWAQVLMHGERAMFIDRPFYMLRRDNPNSSTVSRVKKHCMKEEHDFIRQKIEEAALTPLLKQSMIRYTNRIRFKNYFFTYNRLMEIDRLDYLKFIRDEFFSIREKDGLVPETFDRADWERLTGIAEDPLQFYLDECDMLRRKKGVPPKKKKKKSTSSILKAGFRYLKKNGLKKTVRRVLEKLAS